MVLSDFFCLFGWIGWLGNKFWVIVGGGFGGREGGSLGFLDSFLNSSFSVISVLS